MCFLLHLLDHQEKLQPFCWQRVIVQCEIFCHRLRFCSKSVPESACVWWKWKPVERLCLLSWAAYLLSEVDTSRLSWLLPKSRVAISGWVGSTPVSLVLLTCRYSLSVCVLEDTHCMTVCMDLSLCHVLCFSVSLIYLYDVPLELTVPFNLFMRGDECNECALSSAAPHVACETSCHIFLLCPHPPFPLSMPLTLRVALQW